jgi:hypothetical protein
MFILAIAGCGLVLCATAQGDPVSITVTAPAAGAYWGAGTTETIAWDGALLTGNVEIRLYDYNINSSSYGTYAVLVSGILASQGSWDWAIPSGQANGTQFKIRIVAKSVAGTSDGYLEIGPNDTNEPTVTVNQAAGQNDPAPVPGGSENAIRFEVVFSEPVVGFTVGAVSWAGSTATDISANFDALPIDSPDGKSYLVKVYSCSTGTLVPSIPAGAVTDRAHHPNAASTSTDNSVTVAGPAPRTIEVTAPAAGTQLVMGNTETIKWDGTLLQGNVAIWLYDYNKNSPGYGTYTVLVSDVPATQGSWDWEVPVGLASGSGYKVRVLAGTADFHPSGFSPAFAIVPENSGGCFACSGGSAAPTAIIAAAIVAFLGFLGIVVSWCFEC